MERVQALVVLSSSGFRLYIVNALSLGTLPSALMLRLMDYANVKGAGEVVSWSGFSL